MGNEKSVPVGNFIVVEKAVEPPILSRGTLARQRTKIPWVQNVFLIWLDSTIDSSNSNCQKTINQLRVIVNDIKLYIDGDRCIEFIKTITNNKVCMIVSGALGQNIVPRVQDMSQIDSIFVFCGNKKKHEQWVKEWSKVKGVFTEVGPMCEALKEAVQQCEQNAISISFMATNTGDAFIKSLDPSYLYTQILKEIFLTIQFEQKHITDFIDYCRGPFGGNHNELKSINKLETKYHTETPIWWYTYKCFLHPMLNLGLRLMDMDIIVRMGFFISDLHRHIERLRLEQFRSQSSVKQFTVYRGQGLSKEYFEQLKKTNGGLISFNSFLTTSKNQQVSLKFARKAATNPDLVGILFTMKVDAVQSTTPFAWIGDVTCVHADDEVLFSMNTVFRINGIKQMSRNNRLFEVNLTLPSDNDIDLRALADRIRAESFPEAEGWYRLGLVLIKMDQFDNAGEVFEVLLDQTAKEKDKAPIYDQLGWVKYNQREYQEAITFYEKSVGIYQKTAPPNYLGLGNSYNNIGLAYYSMDDYPKALSSHEKALTIRQNSLPSHHLNLAVSYNNIGIVCTSMSDYTKALSSFEQALAIQQKTLPPDHPDLASTYDNISHAYESMGDYPKALSSHEKSRTTQELLLPPSHPH